MDFRHTNTENGLLDMELLDFLLRFVPRKPLNYLLKGIKMAIFEILRYIENDKMCHHCENLAKPNL